MIHLINATSCVSAQSLFSLFAKYFLLYRRQRSFTPLRRDSLVWDFCNLETSTAVHPDLCLYRGCAVCLPTASLTPYRLVPLAPGHRIALRRSLILRRSSQGVSNSLCEIIKHSFSLLSESVTPHASLAAL